jgi:hypothetical protein
LRETAAEALEKSRQAVTRQKDQLTAAVEAGKAAYREKLEAGVAIDDPAGEIIEGV